MISTPPPKRKAETKLTDFLCNVLCGIILSIFLVFSCFIPSLKQNFSFKNITVLYLITDKKQNNIHCYFHGYLFKYRKYTDTRRYQQSTHTHLYKSQGKIFCCRLAVLFTAFKYQFIVEQIIIKRRNHPCQNCSCSSIP